MGNKFVIPDDVLISAANRMTRESGKCADSWTTYQREKVREYCGPSYGHVPTDDVGRRCINLRKADKLETVNGHGPRKLGKEFSEEYKRALERSGFRELFERVKRHYGYRCAMCYGDRPLEPHHRTYDRLGEELETDVLPVCRNCHKHADKRRQLESKHLPERSLFE